MILVWVFGPWALLVLASFLPSPATCICIVLRRPYGPVSPSVLSSVKQWDWTWAASFVVWCAAPKFWYPSRYTSFCEDFGYTIQRISPFLRMRIWKRYLKMLTAVREGLNFLELNASVVWKLQGGFSFFLAHLGFYSWYYYKRSQLALHFFMEISAHSKTEVV